MTGPDPRLTGPAEAAPPVPYDLAAAIAARFSELAGTTLAGLTAIYQSRAGDGATLPYLVFSKIAITPTLNSGPGYYEAIDWRFNVHGATDDEVGLLGDAVIKAYHKAPLPITSGYTMTFLYTGGTSFEDPARSGLNRGGRSWTRTITFRAKAGRNP